MLKSFSLLLLFIASQAVALGLLFWKPDGPLGGYLCISYALLYLVLLPLSLTDRLRFQPLRASHLRGIGTFLLLATGLSLLLSPLDWVDESVMEQFERITTTTWGAVAICVLGPVIEEVVFRGGVQQQLKRAGLSRFMAILITALLFGIIHGNWMQAVPAVVLGIALGAMYEKYGYSLVIPAHVLNNSLGFIEMKFPQFSDFIASQTPWVAFIAGVVLMGLSLPLFYNLFKQR